MQSAGLDGGVVQQQIMDQQAQKKNTNIGYDVMSGQFAAMILTTEALIADLPDQNAPALPGGMPDY